MLYIVLHGPRYIQSVIYILNIEIVTLINHILTTSGYSKEVTVFMTRTQSVQA